MFYSHVSGPKWKIDLKDHRARMADAGLESGIYTTAAYVLNAVMTCSSLYRGDRGRTGSMALIQIRQ